MKLNQLLNPMNLRAMYEQRTALHIDGSPGVGKSQVTRQIPKLLSAMYGEEFGYVEEMVPSIDAPDVRGFLVPVKGSDGKPQSHYARPALIPSAEYLAAHPRGVIFLDELMQADTMTQKALAPLILERKVGDFQFPEGWWVISASNRAQDKSGVSSALMHVVNRQVRIEVESDIYSWLDWVATHTTRSGHALHPLCVAFAERNPSLVFTNAVPAERKPYCTPRSYVAACELLTTMAVGEDGKLGNELPTNPVVQELVAGSIGEGTAAALFSFAKVAEYLPTLDEIHRDPAGAKVPPKERLDAGYAAAQMVMTVAREHGIGGVWKYAMRLPEELTVMMARRIMKQNESGTNKGSLLDDTTFRDWLMKNSSLVVEVARGMD